MIGVGSEVLGYRIAAPADVPEAGRWWLAEGLEGDAAVWIRAVEPELGEDPRAIELAWERLRHLEHPVVPRAIGVDRSLAAVALAAPLGVPLSKLIELRQEAEFVMTPGTVLDVARSLSDMLVHAHERGRPHGHLSPEVIWVTPEGRLIVWGFGIGPEAPCASGWWSPERARGRRASGDADQWALGAVVATLVTGRGPWRGEDPDAAAREGEISPVAAMVMEQWAPLGRLVERALAAEPRDRFPSVHPLRQAFFALGQRVRQPSDLARMGTELARRLGHPEVVPAEGTARRSVEPEVPVAVIREPPPVEATRRAPDAEGLAGLARVEPRRPAPRVEPMEEEDQDEDTDPSLAPEPDEPAELARGVVAGEITEDGEDEGPATVVPEVAHVSEISPADDRVPPVRGRRLFDTLDVPEERDPEDRRPLPIAAHPRGAGPAFPGPMMLDARTGPAPIYVNEDLEDADPAPIGRALQVLPDPTRYVEIDGGTSPTAVPETRADGTVWAESSIPARRPEGAGEEAARERVPLRTERIDIGPAPASQDLVDIRRVAPYFVGSLLVALVAYVWWAA